MGLKFEKKKIDSDSETDSAVPLVTHLRLIVFVLWLQAALVVVESALMWLLACEEALMSSV